MKILTSGCSFTGGSDVIHDTKTGKLVNNNQITWVTHLAEQHDIKNIAIGGNSNNKILRTTVEELEHTEYDFVIVQWTAIYRTERFSEYTNDWVNFCNTDGIRTDNQNVDIDKNIDLFGWHTDDFANMDPDNPALKTAIKNYDQMAKGLTNDALVTKNIQDYRIEFFKNVLTLQHYLERKNIKYLFSSMSFENHCPNMLDAILFDMKLKLLDVERALLKQMDFAKWSEMPMTRMMDGHVVSQDDGHPNEKGNKLIYNHILKELNKQNG